MRPTTTRIVTMSEVHRLINDLHSVARGIDPDVEERATDTGLTERAEFLAGLTRRQELVRLMVRVSHELNSLDTGSPNLEPDVQPTSYANP